MLALGETIAANPDRPMVSADRSIANAATPLWDRALARAGTITALRAQASMLLGCVARLAAGADAATSALVDLLGGNLQREFDANTNSDWPWPEAILTYENGLLPRALIAAGRQTGDQAMVDTGLSALDWLMSVQTATAGHLSPIGNEWWPRGGVRSRYDQQPIEATALLLAAETALAATGDPRYQAVMELAYAWFLGANDRGVWVADPVRGSGSDGLTPEGLNTNEGAESTLMWLMAAEHVRGMRHALMLEEMAATAALAAASPTAPPTDGPAPPLLPTDANRQPVAAAVR